MSHHLFLLSPSDTPIYSLTHYSNKPAQTTSYPLSSNLPSWSTSAFAGTLTALSGASSATQSHHVQGGGARMGGGQDRHVIQMIANASLDMIEDVMGKENAMYLRSVDKFNEWTVSAFITPGNTKFILLHETKNEEGIRGFFHEVWELYLKMATNRASLLNGLRTGGVRSTSMSAPLSPAPVASFNLPRFASSAINTPIFQEEDDMDQLSDLLSSNLYINNISGHTFTPPIDAPNTTFVHHQVPSHRPLNPNSVPFSPAHLHTPQQQATPADTQLHAYQQMQLMQLEILRLQNAQAQRNQQVQAAVLAEALRQQARRRSPIGFAPASASPANTSFDLRPNTPSARRPSQAELLKAQLGVGTTIPQPDDHHHHFPSLPDSSPQSSSPPKQITILGGGLVRGVSPPHHASKDITPSRSDAATSWRRGNTTYSALNGLRTVSTTSPSVKITPPPGEHLSPPPTPASKLRPRPLSFSSMASSNVPNVAIDSGSEHEDAMSSASSTSQSNPATPQSLTSLEASSLSPREEATKKLYDGLGMGRSAPYIVQAPAMSLPQRLVSHPLRQPRGPPSGADELGPKNFATRIRRKAIGGLGVLMDARERRESIEAY
ncbi:Sedlin, N-terminal conserved region-domain-containing protein [Lanmaoa asiatica]|nr:Sedlin, N-terminal conserved region-domain-containing protein [Lanmaoa asiatica]